MLYFNNAFIFIDHKIAQIRVMKVNLLDGTCNYKILSFLINFGTRMFHQLHQNKCIPQNCNANAYFVSHESCYVTAGVKDDERK